MNEKEFMENKKGVHAMYGEFTLCGDAFDIAEANWDPEYEDGELKETKKKIVTCPDCISLIKYCKSLRTKEIT